MRLDLRGETAYGSMVTSSGAHQAQVFPQLRVGVKLHISSSILTIYGIEDVYTSTDLETINGEIFEEFLGQLLLPIIMPYDGVNPRSILIVMMNINASIHH